MSKEMLAIQAVLAGIRLLRSFGINYAGVIAAQKAADDEGRELTNEEIEGYIGDSREAVDQL